MNAPAIPENEVERLNELYRYELLDSVYEEEFDEIVRLASKLCNVPISLITLVDMNRQWFKARHGLDSSETARSISFCGHAILSEHLFEVTDAVEDSRFFDNPLVVGDPKIRYYAGMPLVTKSGYKIGTLCIIDRVPRELDEDQTFAIEVLSKQVIKLFELRIKSKELKRVSDVQQRIMTIMAHDIRGPLSALKTSYELKNQGLFTEEEINEVEMLVPLQLESTLQLLNNIVDWGSLLLRNTPNEKESFDLHELCNECISYLALSANAKNNLLVNNVTANFTINTNRQGMEFVLRNLISNANKFTSAGSITIAAVRNGDAVEISITDTGVGMSKQAMESVTNRTWTAVSTGTQNEKGSGMGLKLIHEYLTSIHGCINFESIEKQGTTVTITLPQ